MYHFVYISPQRYSLFKIAHHMLCKQTKNSKRYNHHKIAIGNNSPTVTVVCVTQRCVQSTTKIHHHVKVITDILGKIEFL